MKGFSKVLQIYQIYLYQVPDIDVPGTRYDVPVTSIQFDHMCASQASVRIGTENVAAYLPQNIIEFQGPYRGTIILRVL